MKNLARANKLPHAWLLTGSDNDAKLKFVKDFAQWQFCLDRQGDLACNACKTCKLFLAGNHPDYCTITQGIDEVRALHIFLATAAQYGNKKIVLIPAAQNLSQQATNALLKNLEEPSTDCLFFLLVTHQDLLLSTIVSRCQVLNLGIKSSIEANSLSQDLDNLWLTKSLTAAQLVDKLHKQDPSQVLYCFELALSGIIKRKYTCQADYPLSMSKLWSMLDRVKEAQHWFTNKQAANLQLILEDILI